MEDVPEEEKAWHTLEETQLTMLRDEFGIDEPEVMVLVGRAAGGLRMARSFAKPVPEPSGGEPEHSLGELKVVLAELGMNSPLTCRWNGYRWVCH
jgi:hypothetical protein